MDKKVSKNLLRENLCWHVINKIHGEERLMTCQSSRLKQREQEVVLSRLLQEQARTCLGVGL